MSHEYVLLLAKSEQYYFDYQAIQEPANPQYAERYEYPMPGYTNNCHWPNGKGDTQGGMREFQPMRRRRSVWTMATQGYPGHPAAFPEKLAEICVLAGSRVGDTALDCFAGSGTVSAVCQKLGRNSIAIELSADYVKLIEDRLNVVRVSQPLKDRSTARSGDAAQGLIGGKKAAGMSNQKHAQKERVEAVAARERKRAEKIRVA